MPLWEGRGSKSTTRESQFAREIRPLDVVKLIQKQSTVDRFIRNLHELIYRYAA